MLKEGSYLFKHKSFLLSKKWFILAVLLGNRKKIYFALEEHSKVPSHYNIEFYLASPCYELTIGNEFDKFVCDTRMSLSSI